MQNFLLGYVYLVGEPSKTFVTLESIGANVLLVSRNSIISPETSRVIYQVPVVSLIPFQEI